ncbi:hypothetical protein PS928_04236 [Pseudomonas fluorescens]|uniref:Uncharacterized protein n=1 Tax=Pseudomonas fluorescens TaxID=294 RepID=A0A5E7UUH2_PSEFL|nr:hypothetical protein PS928_04236 [Pseudomonas fluorescens]
MTAETKIKISVSFLTAFAVVALWSLMLARPHAEDRISVQSVYDACAARGMPCPNVQIVWSNLR